VKTRFTKKRERNIPSISTASIPDIVFMLLFFFMVATSIRDTETLVETSLPDASQSIKIEKQDYIVNISIGPPLPLYQQKYGSDPLIQLNDKFGKLEDIVGFIENEKHQRPEYVRPDIIYTLMIDKNTTMGIISDVKKELRKADALKITYLTNKKEEFN